MTRAARISLQFSRLPWRARSVQSLFTTTDFSCSKYMIAYSTLDGNHGYLGYLALFLLEQQLLHTLKKMRPSSNGPNHDGGRGIMVSKGRSIMVSKGRDIMVSKGRGIIVSKGRDIIVSKCIVGASWYPRVASIMVSTITDLWSQTEVSKQLL